MTRKHWKYIGAVLVFGGILLILVLVVVGKGDPSLISAGLISIILGMIVRIGLKSTRGKTEN